ncbi:MAG: NADH:ubiquinone oxidoreductase [Deltaproteobacteria bacterium]|nr:MAG: NADH:ubiquinone oxidoreductase [Deltaproteobacteria bacterium]
MSKPKVGFFGLTSCAGDQLMVLNCEDELLKIAGEFEICEFTMAISGHYDGNLDVAFVEGIVAHEKDLKTLEDVRKRSKILVAFGTCAAYGGLPSMEGKFDFNASLKKVYGEETDFLKKLGTRRASPIDRFVKVDFVLPGCPVERDEFLITLASLRKGTLPEFFRRPLCCECKEKENVCLITEEGEVCCGPLTNSGCGARCPSLGSPCAGCRGPLEEIHFDAKAKVYETMGMPLEKVVEKMKNFSAPAWVVSGMEGK